MVQKITLAALIGSGSIIALSFDVANHLLRFLLVGQIPGTSIMLSPVAMLVIFSVVALGIIFAITPRPHLKKSVAKSQLPKRRYSHI